MRHWILVSTFAIMVAACAPGTQAAEQNRGADGSFDRTLNVSGNVDLDITTGAGSIEIRQGGAGRVEIHGRIRAGMDWLFSSREAEDRVRDIEAHPPIEQNGNTIRIGHFDNRDSGRNVSISYEIIAPASATIQSHTGSGRLAISGIEGPVNAGTSSGSIMLTDVHGRVATSTGSGSITATGLRGEFRGHTGSGSIRVEGEQTGRWEMETGSGGVDVRLPRSASFALNAHTGSGAVTVDFPMTVQGRLDRRMRDVSGRVGNGNYTLDVRTGSGHIRIE